MRTVYRLEKVDLMDIKKDDQFIMFEPNGSLVIKNGQASFTALADASPGADSEPGKPRWDVRVRNATKETVYPIPGNEVYAVSAPENFKVEQII